MPGPASPAHNAGREARIRLAAAYRLADRFGFSEGIDNHLTLAVPGEEDRYFLIPYGMHWSEVSASSLLVVDGDGNVTDGEGMAEPTAFLIHGAVHRARPDAKCVMHTHMRHALALGMIKDGGLAMADQNACRYYGRTAFMDAFDGVVYDEAKASPIAEALGDADILFLASHGIIVVGRTVERAWEDLYFLERACAAQVAAMSTGRPLRRVPDDEAASIRDDVLRESGGGLRTADRMFAAHRRLLDRENPGYDA